MPANLFSEAKSIFKATLLGSTFLPVAKFIKTEVFLVFPLSGETLKKYSKIVPLLYVLLCIIF
jgi:hypothetical protein